MSDETKELMDEFVSESLDGLANIENELLAIEEAGAEIDQNLVNKVFRSIHSIKGVSGFLGLDTIGHLAHDIENNLALMRSRELAPDSRRIDIILKASDALRKLIEDVDHSNTVDVSAHIAALRVIAAEAAKPAAATTAAPVAPAAAAVAKPSALETPYPPFQVFGAPIAEAPLRAAPAALPPATEEHAPPAAPVETAHDDHATVLAAADPAHDALTRNGDTSIRVPVSLLDRLMNMAGELVLERNRLLQTISVRDFESIGSVAARIDQVTSEMQEAVMQTRMQPIGNVFGRFPRIVRDLSRQLNKKCELVIEGREVEVDKTIIEAITDPLTHLVRNAMDHGVELPSTREALGKKGTGRILMQAFHQGGKVNLAIRDDGAGIDASKLRAKALAKGVVTPDEARMFSDRETLQLIFRAGFSTAERVTEVSGRGVGMDVVKTNIERLGGTIEIDTVVGQGTTFLLTLPLTLAIIPSLIVLAEGHSYAIPQVNISEVVRVKASEVTKRIEHIKGAEVFRLRDQLLPLLRLTKVMGIDAQTAPVPDLDGLRDRHVHAATGDLGAMLDLASSGPGSAPIVRAAKESAIVRRPRTEALKIVVVESGRLRYGLVVDAIYDSKEIVVKPLGRHLKSISCLAGATILGDGRVALILDVTGVATAGNLRQPADGSRMSDVPATESLREVQTVLIFSNSPSELFAVPMSLVSRIERVKREQIDSIGGRALMQAGNRSIPLIGLENHINAAPRPDQSRYFVMIFNVREREAGIIAPNLVDIRQITDVIDTGILAQTGVSGSVVFGGKATRVIDLFELARAAYPEWFAESPKDEAKPTVLVAEDNPFFRSQLRGVMSAFGYSLVVCEDGADAWDTLSRSKTVIDAVVTDIEMPRLDGLELTRRIKSDPNLRHIPVIMVTSLQSDADVRRGKDVGADEYQCKFNREKLLAGLERAIGSRRRTPAASGLGGGK
jgi:two-component system, chemotaxis family, sensor kinase CheA